MEDTNKEETAEQSHSNMGRTAMFESDDNFQILQSATGLSKQDIVDLQNTVENELDKLSNLNAQQQTEATSSATPAVHATVEQQLTSKVFIGSRAPTQPATGQPTVAFTSPSQAKAAVPAAAQPIRTIIPVAATQSVRSKSPLKIAPAPTYRNAQSIPALINQQQVFVVASNPGSAATNASLLSQSPPKKVFIRSIAGTRKAGVPPIRCANVIEAVRLPSTSTSATSQAIQVPGAKFNYVRVVSAPKFRMSPHNKSYGTGIVKTSKTLLAPATPSSAMGRQVLPLPSKHPTPIRPTVATVVKTEKAGIYSEPQASSSLNTSQKEKSAASLSSNLPTISKVALPQGGDKASRFAEHDSFLNEMDGFSPYANGATLEATGIRPRKPCNCTKSQCLKLYCDCFANGEFCNNCNCSNCSNNLNHDNDRSKAIKACLDRNPNAFHPKIGKGNTETERRHNKGCNCKRSSCLKNYCECYEAKISCTSLCKCLGCKNYDECGDRRTLMNLADSIHLSSQPNRSATSRLNLQTKDVPTKPATSLTSRLPHTLLTEPVIERVIEVMVVGMIENEKAEKEANVPHDSYNAQKLILENFGKCLRQIVDAAEEDDEDDEDL